MCNKEPNIPALPNTTKHLNFAQPKSNQGRTHSCSRVASLTNKITKIRNKNIFFNRTVYFLILIIWIYHYRSPYNYIIIYSCKKHCRNKFNKEQTRNIPAKMTAARRRRRHFVRPAPFDSEGLLGGRLGGVRRRDSGHLGGGIIIRKMNEYLFISVYILYPSKT